MIKATTSALPSQRPDGYLTADTLPPATSPPNLRAESAAICELSKSLAEDPDATVRHVLDIAQDLCGAGSAGLSLMRQNQTGEAIVGDDSHRAHMVARRPAAGFFACDAPLLGCT